jgi:hypothetical protein
MAKISLVSVFFAALDTVSHPATLQLFISILYLHKRMKDIGRVLSLLSAEQLKAMEEVLDKRQLTLDSFKLLRKDYARVKTNVKRIEKKLLALMEEDGDDKFTCKWIEREIASIENKYPAIEKAMKHYNEAMKSFNHTITAPYFLSFRPEEPTPGWSGSPLRSLKSYLSSADSRIDEAANAIRITKRYFKNAASAFKSHATLKAARKQRDERLRQNELKLAKEAELNNSTATLDSPINPSVIEIPLILDNPLLTKNPPITENPPVIDNPPITDQPTE